MMRFGIKEEIWAAAKAEIVTILAAKANQTDPLISYTDLAGQLSSVKLGPEDKALHELLGEISKDEHLAGRGMLSALVVHKHDRNPGPGLFSLAKRLGYKFSDNESFWIAELNKLRLSSKSIGAAPTKPVDREGRTSSGRSLETLPFQIPEYQGSSHPISRGAPKFYKPDDLKDWGRGETDRTRFFERMLLGIFFRIGRPVPYAFYTYSGEIRSLDAGCLKFLVNRAPPEISFICDPDGEINAVLPSEKLIARYSGDAALFSEFADDIVPKLAFDVESNVDERRKQISQRVAREGAGAFRSAILWAWSNCCAMSGTAVSCVIEGAHIYPYNGISTNDPSNGLALRSDVHVLFDAHLVSIKYVGASLVVQVSNELIGTEYERLAHLKIRLPSAATHRPHPSLVQYHFRQFEKAEAKRGR